ncbi:endonuclease/exonuclease/phosphatase family protein [Roseovarius sp. C7]|uniref:endonuclease/exonuclease/phosphatase family protein n=1 Tax=Roseovarius sp. C7 TaxID=3398643 RepID=UPI0039F6E5AF
MIYTTCSDLPPVTDDQRARILNAPRDAENHRALLAATPAMNTIETGGIPTQNRLDTAPLVAAWNLERCLFPDATAKHLAGLAPDVILLSEMDCGMARTGQRHTTRDLAQALGMSYAYGVEFYELGLGGPTERRFCTDDHNRLGFHGNAILSAAPLTRVAMIRLDDHGPWFDADPDQPRLGTRMALAAQIDTASGPICVVSTHLESNAQASYRHDQFLHLLERVDFFAQGYPIAIGGDLNTGNHMPPDFDWRKETLFDLARALGYSWQGSAPGQTTRASLITPHPDRSMRLDWIATRDVSPAERGILPAVAPDDTPLSDHDCVWCQLA